MVGHGLIREDRGDDPGRRNRAGGDLVAGDARDAFE
jgi:hypothetical protein